MSGLLLFLNVLFTFCLLDTLYKFLFLKTQGFPQILSDFCMYKKNLQCTVAYQPTIYNAPNCFKRIEHEKALGLS